MNTTFSRRTALKSIAGGIAAVGAALTLPARGQAAEGKGKGNIRHSVCKWCYGSTGLEKLAAKAASLGMESVELLKAGGAKVLWTRGIKRDRYYGSPVVHDGLLYAFTRNHTLTVLDVKTGETLYAKRVPGLKGQGYMSPTVAGGRIYLNGEKGTLVAQQTGGDYVEAAPVIFGAFRSTPIFAENRMFLRTYENLFCFR